MRIGIDLDGTITDFYSYLVTFGREFGKENFNNDKIKNYYGFEIEEIFDWNEEEIIKFKEYVRTTLRMEVKPRIFAKECLYRLHKLGHIIYIITSRKEEDQYDTLNNTKKWLKDNNIYYDYLLLGNSNKLEECLNNKIDIFVDDKIKHCSKTQSANIRTYLFDNPYNRNSSLNRVNNFYELYKNIVTE